MIKNRSSIPAPKKARGAKEMADSDKILQIDPTEIEILIEKFEQNKLLRHEVASITVKTARAGLHPLFHQRFPTGMNKELPGQCNLIT
jgi:hypothetical protein